MAACKRAVSAREFGLWVAWNRISPIGPERADLRMANLIWHVMNVLSSKEYPFRKCLMDFDPDGPKDAAPVANIKQVFDQYAEAVKGSQEARERKGTP